MGETVGSPEELKKEDSTPRFAPEPDWYDNYLRAREPADDKEEER